MFKKPSDSPSLKLKKKVFYLCIQLDREEDCSSSSSLCKSMAFSFSGAKGGSFKERGTLIHHVFLHPHLHFQHLAVLPSIHDLVGFSNLPKRSGEMQCSQRELIARQQQTVLVPLLQCYRKYIILKNIYESHFCHWAEINRKKIHLYNNIITK